MDMWDDDCMRRGLVRDRLHVRVLLDCIHDDDKPFRSDVAIIETVACMESVSSHVPVSVGIVMRLTVEGGRRNRSFGGGVIRQRGAHTR